MGLALLFGAFSGLAEHDAIASFVNLALDHYSLKKGGRIVSPPLIDRELGRVMSGVKNVSHPAYGVSVHLLNRIADAPTAVEARKREICAYELMLNLEGEEAISKLDTDNLQVLFSVALEKRLCDIP